MKSALILGALANSVLAGAPILTRITPEALTKLQQNTPITRLDTPAQGAAVISRPTDQSIINQSMILNDGKNWTLVPQGAVLFLPEAMASRVSPKPVGTLLSWTDFLTQNRGWITTSDVSFNQAAGREALPAERVTFWAKQDKVVIAVHQNGPISVRLNSENQALTQR